MRVNTTGFLCTAKHSVLTLLCRAELSSGTTGSSAILQSKYKPCAGEPALHGSSNKNTGKEVDALPSSSSSSRASARKSRENTGPLRRKPRPA